ncbi:MAG: ABC transporter substrate-binding protein [Elusimicrobia bacterium]|nr:ABC transporter substrate-binding protein [Elusimicrobiota bacterium]
MTRSSAIAAMIVAALAVPATSDVKSAETPTLTFALPTLVPAVLPCVAAEKGFFEENGLRVTLKVHRYGPDAMGELLSGGAQVFAGPETSSVRAAVQGHDVVTIATVARTVQARLIARMDAPHSISEPKDLVGKRVATALGSDADFFLHAFLATHGVPASRVSISSMPVSEMPEALAKGRIDAYAAWEPFVLYGANLLHRHFRIFLPHKIYRGWTAVSVLRDFADKNPETLRRLLAALIKAEEFARRNPEQALKIAARRFELRPEVVKAVLIDDTLAVELDQELVETMRAQSDWAAGVVTPSGNAREARARVDERALMSERPASVKLK